MATHPNDPTPEDSPLHPNLPPEPADLFDLEGDPPPTLQPNDAEPIDEDDLFNFDSALTEPIVSIQDAATIPAEDDEDILDWGVVAEESSTSFVRKKDPRAPEDESILGGEVAPTSVGSGWLGSATNLQTPDDDMEDALFQIPDTGPQSSSSGVNLHDPEAPADRASGSSIFGSAATDESSRVEIAIPHSSGEQTDAIDAVGPASIWDEELESLTSEKIASMKEDRGGEIDWNDNSPAGDQQTMRASRPGDPENDDLDLEGMLDVDLEPDDAEVVSPSQVALSDTTGAGLPVRPQPLVAHSQEDIPDLESDDDDSEETPRGRLAEPRRPRPPEEKKGKSGAIGWVGGSVLGLLVGGGGIFGLSQMDLLPGQNARPIVSDSGKTPPVAAEKLAELQKAADQAEQARQEAAKKLEDAAAKLASVEKNAERAASELAAAKMASEKADTDRLDAIKRLNETETKLIAVIKESDKAKVDLVVAQDDLKAATKQVTDTQKLAKANEDLLAGLLKDARAAKLVPEDADTSTAIAKLVEAAKSSTNGDAKKLAESLAAAKKQVETTQSQLKTANDELLKAKTEADKAQKLVDDKAKDLADAREKSKADEAVLASLVKEFKAAKLIPEDADLATVLKKLPDAAKQAAAAATSGDAKKAAEALVAAKKEVEVAQASLRAAETELARAKKEAKDAMLVAEKATATAKADAAKAVDVAKAEAEKATKAQQASDMLLAQAKKEAEEKLKAAQVNADREATAKAAAQAEVKQLAARAAEQEVEFARQLALAKATGGATGPLLMSPAVTQEKAATSYATGAIHYFAGRYPEAEKDLRQATVTGADARYNYFLGLALFAQGKKEEAVESFRAGAVLERRNQPNYRDIGEALERVQGAARMELSKYRPR